MAITEDIRNPATFAAAYREHAPRALAAAQRVLGERAAAEDVVQDVFLSLWREPQKFDPRRGTLRTYVAMMARSRALDRIRTRTAGESAVDRLAHEVSVAPRFGQAPDEAVLDREQARSAVGALKTLPGEQREALVLSFGAGLSTRELAAATGVPLGTAKSRVRLALSKAREQLEPAAAA
ncbi:MAG TPA: sigma-70 family RNA polymerase sigma factor [Thermoleophilaceae bacterium]|nr:sigma-70 family RNA polymerase sigma factor [Thermoleophilaceae bacterium]